MDFMGMFSGFGQSLGLVSASNNIALNVPAGNVVNKISVADSPSTVPQAGTSWIDSAINTVAKIAGAGIGIAAAYNNANKEPQYVTGTPQTLTLTTVTPGVSTPGTSQVINLPGNTIFTTPTTTQGTQAVGNNSMLWLLIALLVIVGIAVMRKGS